MIKLHNTLTGKKDEFTPLDPKNVGMYVCGPTVYDRAHIGNARAVVVFDVLYRTLRHQYGEKHVTYVRNITDVDDKINAAAKARNIEISELTINTTKMFHDDMAALGCLPPNIEPRATENIDGMIEMCQTLIKNGNAYAAEGHVLFSVATDPKYGHLSHRSRDEMIAGARVEVAPYKKDPADFVLWKPSASDEPGWDSPWGRGRPGWHIECSVMSTKYLGATFDIHGGGADLKFPHHENEIAQSCCAYPGSQFARYWVHNGFLTVEGEKMSKSLGNFMTVHDLLEKKIKGEVIRCALLATHYSKPLDWTEKAVSDAEKMLKKLYKAASKNSGGKWYYPPTQINEKDLDEQFIEALRDDLNTPKAFSILHKLADNGDSAKLQACASMLGLVTEAYNEHEQGNLDKSFIEQQIILRITARLSKNWAESDRIRNELAAQGIILKDNPDGTTSWERK
jgi:cysteinyl-tRNA synthetase